jgi:hypothetical protein
LCASCFAGAGGLGVLAASAMRVGGIRPTLSQAPVLPAITRPTPRSPQATELRGWGRARQHAHACRTRRRACALGGERPVPPPDHARVGREVLLAVHGRGAGCQRSGGPDPPGVGGDSGRTAGLNGAGVPVAPRLPADRNLRLHPARKCPPPCSFRAPKRFQGPAEIQPLSDASLPACMVFPQLPPPAARRHPASAETHARLAAAQRGWASDFLGRCVLWMHNRDPRLRRSGRRQPLEPPGRMQETGWAGLRAEVLAALPRSQEAQGIADPQALPFRLPPQGHRARGTVLRAGQATG